jgi:hypothetical protein
VVLPAWPVPVRLRAALRAGLIDQEATMNIADQPAAGLAVAIQTGDIAEVGRLLAGYPGLAAEQFTGRGGGTKTALHIVADWPGYFPGGPQIVPILIAAGADPDARTSGGAPETPLHWAASSDDADVARALIDGGADLETPGGSIGTPLDNAIGYGCWHVARLLVQRGARVEQLWHAAALGLLDRLEELLAGRPGSEDISHAFWQACHGGQRRAAERLLNAGADLSYHPGYADETPAQIAATHGEQRSNVIRWLGEQALSRP